MADLFAGTGALGIEALSHGARWCPLVDDSAPTAAASNAKTSRRWASPAQPASGGATRPIWDRFHWPPAVRSIWVFLEPPYRKDSIPKALTSLKDGGWLAPNGLLVAESNVNEEIDLSGFTPLDERDYGETLVRFLTPALELRCAAIAAHHLAGGIKFHHSITSRLGRLQCTVMPPTPAKTSINSGSGSASSAPWPNRLRHWLCPSDAAGLTRDGDDAGGPQFQIVGIMFQNPVQVVAAFHTAIQSSAKDRAKAETDLAATLSDCATATVGMQSAITIMSHFIAAPLAYLR